LAQRVIEGRISASVATVRSGPVWSSLMSVQHSSRSDLGLDWSLIGLYGLASTDRKGPLSIPILGRCMAITPAYGPLALYNSSSLASLHFITIISHLAICCLNAIWPMYPPPPEACAEELGRPAQANDENRQTTCAKTMTASYLPVISSWVTSANMLRVASTSVQGSGAPASAKVNSDVTNLQQAVRG
jgi:hypothetical protein